MENIKKLKNKYIIVGDDISNLKIYEIINNYFGQNYSGWMKAWYDIDGEYAAWFPIIEADDSKKILQNGNKYKNKVSSDGKYIYEINTEPTENDIEKNDSDKKIRFVFARIHDCFQFLGIYNKKSIDKADTITTTFERIAIGADVSRMRIIKDYPLYNFKEMEEVLDYYGFERKLVSSVMRQIVSKGTTIHYRNNEECILYCTEDDYKNVITKISSTGNIRLVNTKDKSKEEVLSEIKNEKDESLDNIICIENGNTVLNHTSAPKYQPHEIILYSNSNFFRVIRCLGSISATSKIEANDSIWVATALMAYEKYIGMNDVTKEDMYFKQTDIGERASRITDGKGWAARTSQHCNADAYSHSNNYLRADNEKGVLRRLTAPGEFKDKTYPRKITKSVKFNLTNGKIITFDELISFAKTKYTEIVLGENILMAHKKGWLLTYNPDNFDWESFDNDCKLSKLGTSKYMDWKCQSKKPQIDDDVFMIKIGKELPKGIFAHGYVYKTSFIAPHYDEEKAAQGETINKIGVEFDWIQDYNYESILDQDMLKQQFPGQDWSPQSSGIELKNCLPEVLNLWEELKGLNQEDKNMKFDKNMILYGPPGTGKTYNTVIYAVAIDGKEGTLEDIKTKVKNKPEYYNEIKKAYDKLVEDGKVAFTTFHQSYSYEDFIEGIRPVLDINQNEDNSNDISYEIKDGVFKEFCEVASRPIIVKEDDQVLTKPNDEKYIFIIDEINRGNISKIFGELITLIEDTKRAQGDEAASAILPYSGKRFSVPSNVYILGTMNTADRSIAIMDTALRRRFSFVEMMPDSELLMDIIISENGKSVNVGKMLDVINKRIEFLFDREHTIGHAFFLKLKKNPSVELLGEIFMKSVVPLLQEYFYGDYEKIQLVLGDNGKEDKDKFILGKSTDPNSIFRKKNKLEKSIMYSINKDAFFNIDSYIGIINEPQDIKEEDKEVNIFNE